MATAGDGVTARTASARVLIRGGTDEQTGEALTAAVAAERVRWCAALVRGLAARLVEGHWSAADVAGLGWGGGAPGRARPEVAGVGRRRPGGGGVPPGGIPGEDHPLWRAAEQGGK